MRPRDLPTFAIAFALSVISAAALTGCGGLASETCVFNTFVTPPTATADHAAAPPANQVQFYEGKGVVSGKCAVPEVLTSGPLTSSDATNVSVSATGLVTCVHTTPKPITLSPAGVTGLTASATLTCN